MKQNKYSINTDQEGREGWAACQNRSENQNVVHMQ